MKKFTNKLLISLLITTNILLLSTNFTNLVFGGQLSSQTAGLMGLWHLETSSPAIDSTNRGHTGAPTGGVSFVTGKFGNAYGFDGNTDSEIRIPYSTDFLPNNGQLTVMFWFKENSTTQQKALISRWGSANDEWIILYNIYAVGDKAIRIYSTSAAKFVETAAISTGTWNHITFVYDTSTTNRTFIYNNGYDVTKNNQTNPFTITNSTVKLVIAGDDIGGNNSNHYIDEVAIFNRALSVAEIRAIYNDQARGRKKTDEN